MYRARYDLPHQAGIREFQTMSKREPMSSIDTAWLRMDRPTNRMVVIGVMTLDGTLPVERFRRIIASGFLGHRRFRQRAVLDGDTAYWEQDPNFDLSFHVKRTALPRPAGKAELYDLVSDLASTASPPMRLRPARWTHR